MYIVGGARNVFFTLSLDFFTRSFCSSNWNVSKKLEGLRRSRSDYLASSLEQEWSQSRYASTETENRALDENNVGLTTPLHKVAIIDTLEFQKCKINFVIREGHLESAGKAVLVLSCQIFGAICVASASGELQDSNQVSRSRSNMVNSKLPLPSSVP